MPTNPSPGMYGRQSSNAPSNRMSDKFAKPRSWPASTTRCLFWEKPIRPGTSIWPTSKGTWNYGQRPTRTEWQRWKGSFRRPRQKFGKSQLGFGYPQPRSGNRAPPPAWRSPPAQTLTSAPSKPPTPPELGSTLRLIPGPTRRNRPPAVPTTPEMRRRLDQLRRPPPAQTTQPEPAAAGGGRTPPPAAGGTTAGPPPLSSLGSSSHPPSELPSEPP